VVNTSPSSRERKRHNASRAWIENENATEEVKKRAFFAYHRATTDRQTERERVCVFFLGTKQRERRKKRDLLFAFFHRKREKKIFCYFLCLLVDFFIRKHNKEKKIKTLTHLSIHKSGFTI
jgi:hypothetical protein